MHLYAARIHRHLLEAHREPASTRVRDLRRAHDAAKQLIDLLKRERDERGFPLFDELVTALETQLPQYLDTLERMAQEDQTLPQHRPGRPLLRPLLYDLARHLCARGKSFPEIVTIISPDCHTCGSR